jgi:hypothetical protein
MHFQQFQRFPWLVGAGLLFAAAAAEPAVVVEWRFCLAPSNQDHKIYMTAPFPAAISTEALEAGFHKLLEQAGYHHDSVQCPTGGGEQAVRGMRQHAGEFNLQVGNQVILMDWRGPRR